jgi:hypothetical protein
VAEPPGLDEDWDPDGPPPPGEDELTAEELAEIEAAAADELLALRAASSGRRGPAQPGSARLFPGESSSAAGGFGPGLALDVMPGCAGLALAADAAVGDGDCYDGASDAELIGVLCAWDRLEAHMAARKLAAVAELIRQRKNCIVIGVTSASLASFAHRPYGRRAAAARGSLATGRSRVGRACIAPLPDCQAANAGVVSG